MVDLTAPLSGQTPILQLPPPFANMQTHMASHCALFGNPTIAFLATDKVIGNLLGGFPTGDSNPIPPFLFVVDEDMRTRTLNSRLSFESYFIAAGCVANLSTHQYVPAGLTVFSDSKERLDSASAHLV